MRVRLAPPAVSRSNQKGASMHPRVARTTAGLCAAVLATSLALVGAPAQADTTFPAPTYTNSADDNRVIYQAFSLFQPNENTAYDTLAGRVDELAELGITDIWMPPPYRAFGLSRYHEGYSVQDRYDLGEFDLNPGDGETAPDPTKYGTRADLDGVLQAIHGAGLEAQVDLVPNQVMGLPSQEPVIVRRTDADGDLWTNSWTTEQPSTLDAELYLAYTVGGGPGQQQYGSLPSFNVTHFNGTSLQQIGMGDPLRDPASDQPYRVTAGVPGAPSGITTALFPVHAPDGLPTYLADAIAAEDWATVNGNMNNVEGFLSASGAFNSGGNNWVPLLLVTDPRFGEWLADDQPAMDADSNGTVTWAEVVASPSYGTIWGLRDEFKAAQPEYTKRSEEPSFANDRSGIDQHDEFLFLDPATVTVNNQTWQIDGSAAEPRWEINTGLADGQEFLLGNDLANENPAVRTEQRNWMDWLTGGATGGPAFDGFRIDAAAHVSPEVLTDAADVIEENCPDGRRCLSYIETYESSQYAFEVGINQPQLSYDALQYFALRETLGKADDTSWALRDLYNRALVDRTGVTQAGLDVKNWSFVNNHDQEKNIVNEIILDELGITPSTEWGTATPRSFEEEYTPALQEKALEVYNAELDGTAKNWVVDNVPAQYAVILSNKGTVPAVFYGDLYRTDAPYMSEKTPYYDMIAALLKAREQYATGDQRVSFHTSNTSPNEEGRDLVASVRQGTSRSTGLATVVSDAVGINTEISVEMGAQHANQAFYDVTGQQSTTFHTDANGVLTVRVKGVRTPQVQGFLGVYAPVDAAACTESFTDVPTGLAFAADIRWAACNDIANGWGDGSYRPVQPIARDAMMAFIYRLAGEPQFTPPSTPSFIDVSTDDAFYKEIEWARAEGITQGWDDNTFRPLQGTNRDAMATFLYRLAGRPAFTAPTSPTFSDVGTGDAFAMEIEWMASTGITTGWSDGTYRPGQPVNRDAMAAFLHRWDALFDATA